MMDKRALEHEQKRSTRGRLKLYNLKTAILASLILNLIFFNGNLLYALASTPVSAGYRDYSYGTSGNSTPTGEKPESKLWWNDGYWWGSLYNDAAQEYHIYRLDLGNQNWIDTGTVLDDRNTSKADALWDGQHLYVASHVFTNTGGSSSSGSWGRLYRYSYNSSAKTYSLDAGFPVDITQGNSETLVLAKDSTGKLWVTYVQNSQVYINRSTNGDLVWGTPFVLPVSANVVNVASDDISSIIAFQGNKIGVMWSNQLTKKMYFSVHLDGNADNVWQPEQTALPGPNCTSGACADDHINLKSLQADNSGRVFAAIKTSLSTSNAPLVMLLVRDLQGNWSNAVFGRVSDHHTRPIVLLDEEHGRIYMFATAPESGGSIYYKTTDINNPTFSLGLGTPFIQSSTDTNINNATSTKQNLNSSTGLVVLASDNSTNFYLHNYIDLGGGGGGGSIPTISSFTPASGAPGIEVTITGNNFNGATAVAFNGSNAASYTVDSNTQIRAIVPGAATTGRISVTNPAGTGLSSQDFIVTQPSPGLTFNPTDDSQVKSTSPNKNFGTATTFRLKNSSTIFNSYLKFDVSGLTGPVSSAHLRLYVTDPSNDGGSLYMVSNNYAGTNIPWTEGGITWNNAPVLSGSPLVAAGAVSLNTWVDLDVTAAISGDGTYSFGLSTSSSNSVYYSSKEGGNPPELVIYLASP